jgi:electron transfer flavoprotein alpha subunit
MSGVLVIQEERGFGRNRISHEALAAGRILCGLTGLSLETAVVGDSNTPVLAETSGQPPATAYAVEHPLLANYTSDGYVLAFEQLIRKLQPSYIVFPHTYQVRDFVPRLAARFGQVLIGDVMALEAGPSFVRQLFQGKMNAQYRHLGNGPCFVSVQAGAFPADPVTAGTANIVPFVPEIADTSIRTRPGQPFRASAQTVDLASAQLIVSVGRGIKDAENIPLVQELAAALGAELAASRPICDNGWLPMERQVGSSGQTVSPKLYLAVGISGAIQHLVGMKGSQCVVAINKDPAAPIFEVADYGIVGDLFEVVPALTEAVKAARQ